jgi:hypothetical protein
MAVGETDAVVRQSIDMGRLDFRGPITADVPVAEIIGEDENNVRQILSLLKGRILQGRCGERRDE